MVGVKAPDANRIGEDQREHASPARRLLKNLAAHIPGGRKTPWWAWCQWIQESWGAEFAARLIIDSPTGTVAANPHIQELARQFVELGRAVDRALNGRRDIDAEE